VAITDALHHSLQLDLVLQCKHLGKELLWVWKKEYSSVKGENYIIIMFQPKSTQLGTKYG